MVGVGHLVAGRGWGRTGRWTEGSGWCVSEAGGRGGPMVAGEREKGVPFFFSSLVSWSGRFGRLGGWLWPAACRRVGRWGRGGSSGTVVVGVVVVVVDNWWEGIAS
ncbi:hypothetical protein RND81_03G041200 [Saponaria officinalis]|uniref:Uncharacterized protein n=1 Tax=Saponaria officinalis TaxID=3572 RepID=A0AAW1M3E9_SAPOF